MFASWKSQSTHQVTKTLQEAEWLVRFLIVGLSREIRLKIQVTPLKTNMSPEKGDYFNRKYIFQPVIFRGHFIFPGSTLSSKRNLQFAFKDWQVRSLLLIKGWTKSDFFVHIAFMYGIFTCIYQRKSTKCRYTIHGWYGVSTVHWLLIGYLLPRAGAPHQLLGLRKKKAAKKIICHFFFFMIFLWFQFDFHYDQIYDLKTIYGFFRLNLHFFYE